MLSDKSLIARNSVTTCTFCDFRFLNCSGGWYHHSLTHTRETEASHADPLASVALGTGKMLSDFKLLRKVSIE